MVRGLRVGVIYSTVRCQCLLSPREEAVDYIHHFNKGYLCITRNAGIRSRVECTKDEVILPRYDTTERVFSS